jgi:hypothetical protein
MTLIRDLRLTRHCRTSLDLRSCSRRVAPNGMIDESAARFTPGVACRRSSSFATNLGRDGPVV